MAREFERRVVECVAKSLAATIGTTPDWLIRPGKAECGAIWPIISAIYHDLTGLTLPDTMRSIERRTVDAVLIVQDHAPRILEVDEPQHFNAYRAMTLRHYPDRPIAFEASSWITRCEAKTRLEGGGFARPMPPLFPGENGRHRQRAFRDALCDLLPPMHGFAPTLRISSYEAKDWIFLRGAESRIARLLVDRFR